MGGYGSGRWGWHSKKPTMEGCLSLDVRWLHRQGMLREDQNCKGHCSWKDDQGQDAASLSLAASAQALHLSYTVTWYDGSREPERIAYTVPVVWTPCYFGGKRPWMLCPGRGCGRRVAKLYRPPSSGHFLCRHCHGLAYASQRQGEWYRLLQKAWRIKAHVGGVPGLQYPFPPAPPRMHLKTYHRLWQKYGQVARKACQVGLAEAARMRARPEGRYRQRRNPKVCAGQTCPPA